MAKAIVGFHFQEIPLDGDRTNNNIRNLAKVHYNQVRFQMLKESRILWMPKAKEEING